MFVNVSCRPSQRPNIFIHSLSRAKMSCRVDTFYSNLPLASRTTFSKKSFSGIIRGNQCLLYRHEFLISIFFTGVCKSTNYTNYFKVTILLYAIDLARLTSFNGKFFLFKLSLKTGLVRLVEMHTKHVF